VAFPVGTLLGSYQITAAIGAGGMGEVYRGRDAALNRDVAIKVLPAAMASDADGLARFKREAQVLASLNHPNIAHVYGFEGATLPDGSTVHFLAMEMVEGEDLAERLRRGAIPVDEAIAIAKQIADGLEEAHERGIIHRDLKPANVKVTPDGKVKILDFGLAKAMEGDPSTSAANSQMSHSPTMSRHMTEAGMIMGTAAYMSPEQARGKTLDKRADIWSFGVVLFEMLSGERLFIGETVSDVLAAVLTRDPDPRRLPAATPGPIRRLIQRCLERDAKKRLRDIGEARLQLEESAGGGAAEEAAPAALPRRSDRRLILALGSLAALFAALSMFLVSSRRDVAEPPPAALTRFSLVSDPAVIVTTELTVPFAVSPDGRTIVFTAIRSGEPKGLWRRTLDDPEPRPIPGGEGGTQPAISPDGKWIAFLVGFHEVHKLPIEGGSAVRIGDIAGNSAALTWASNEEVLGETFAERSGLQRLPAAGGEPREVFPLDAASGELRQRAPFVIPGTDRVVFLSQTKDNHDTLVMGSLTDGRRESLAIEGARALGLFDGRLIYARPAGQVAALPVDVGTMRATGPAIDLPDFVAADSRGARVALSAGGTLVYRAGSTPTRIELLGRGGTLRALGREAAIWGAPRFSPDGRTIVAAQKVSSVGGSVDLWSLDTSSGEATKLTRTGAAFAPEWRAGGRQVAFIAGAKRWELWSLPLDGSAPPGLWVDLKGEASGVTVAPDDRSLVAVAWSSGRDNLVRVALSGGEPAIEPLLARGESLRWPECPRISPDGRLVAFSAEPGEVFVLPLSGGGLLQASDGATSCAAWGPDSRTLYYTVGADLRAVRIETSPKLSVESRRVEARLGRRVEALDVSPDGRAFVFVTSNTGADVYVVPGWAETVRRRWRE
jgi:Tol biopolymer transport system component